MSCGVLFVLSVLLSLYASDDLSALNRAESVFDFCVHCFVLDLFSFGLVQTC